jgi:hypothetical protein
MFSQTILCKGNSHDRIPPPTPWLRLLPLRRRTWCSTGSQIKAICGAARRPDFSCYRRSNCARIFDQSGQYKAGIIGGARQHALVFCATQASNLDLWEAGREKGRQGFNCEEKRTRFFSLGLQSGPDEAGSGCIARHGVELAEH